MRACIRCGRALSRLKVKSHHTYQVSRESQAKKKINIILHTYTVLFARLFCLSCSLSSCFRSCVLARVQPLRFTNSTIVCFFSAAENKQQIFWLAFVALSLQLVRKLFFARAKTKHYTPIYKENEYTRRSARSSKKKKNQPNRTFVFLNTINMF